MKGGEPGERTARLDGTARSGDAERLRAERVALRGQGREFVQQQDWAAAVVVLRRLRKLGGSGPLDHHRLFRLLATTGRQALLERYLRLLRTIPVPADWRRAALAFWSEGHGEDLARVARRHPKGPAAALAYLRDLATVSSDLPEKGPGDAALMAIERLKSDEDTREPGSPSDPDRHPSPATAAPRDLSRMALPEIRHGLPEVLEELSGMAEGPAKAAAERRVEDAVAGRSRLTRDFAHYLTGTGRDGRAIGLVAGLAESAMIPREWLKWARIAQAADIPAEAAAFARHAARGGTYFHVRDASLLLGEAGLDDDAIAIWSRADGISPLHARLGRLRAMRRLDRTDALIDTALETLVGALPADALASEDAVHLIAITRLFVGSAYGLRTHERLRTYRAPGEPAETGALGLWIRAMLAAAALDKAAALELLTRAADLPLDATLPLDIAHEIAVMHLRYNRIGAARRRRDAATRPLPPAAAAYYARALALIDRVEAVAPGAELYPECLIDIIAERLSSHPATLTPAEPRVVTVTASLAHGGGERQTVTICKALAHGPAVPHQTLAVRSIEGKLGFFAPTAAALPIELAIYGTDWRRRTEMAEVAGLIDADARTLGAIDLLPYTVREDVLRLIALFSARRPAAVHIRQDLYAAAIAAALVGVPVFFIHRGSLARDTWELDALERETMLRPMRHVYRRLLDATGLFIVNNSEVGRASDLAWLDPADPARVVVVHNAVDFDGLGWDEGPNPALRAELGIPSDAPLVGTVFRMEAVKRPLLWVETAARVLAAVPDAHFLMAGGGRLEGAVAARAAELGVAERLHLPGPVSDVGNWYRMMDVFLLTSEREGLPNVLIEAQHFGVPVVSSDVGGARETMSPGVTGLLVPADGGAGQLADAVIAALTDRQWADAASRSGRSFVGGQFGSARAVAALLDLYGLDRFHRLGSESSSQPPE